MEQKVARSLDAVVRFSVAVVLLTAWAWPIWRLIWSRDLVPGLAGLLAAVWLFAGCLVLARVMPIARPTRWAYALTPLGALVGMVVGGGLLVLLVAGLKAAEVFKPVLILWLACIFVWPVVGLLRRRASAWRLAVLAAVALCAFAAVVGFTLRDRSQARTAQARATAAGQRAQADTQRSRATAISMDWPLAPGSALGATTMLTIGAWVSRRRSRRATAQGSASTPDSGACPTSASSRPDR